MRDTTIVIPCYRPLSLLKGCIESILRNTDLNRVEILVVCNGSEIVTIDYLKTLPDCVRFVWFAEGLGFTRAANIGLKIVHTPYAVLFNTDSQILDFWPRNQWLDTLLKPLKDNPKVAVTGTADMYFMGKMYLPFFFVGLNMNTLKEFNYLDEEFSPGYGEDADFCFKAQSKGYLLDVITSDRLSDNTNKQYITGYPIYHQGRASFKEAGAILSQKGESILHQRIITNFYN